MTRLALALLLCLAGCGGQNYPTHDATIDPPDCSASGACR